MSLQVIIADRTLSSSWKGHDSLWLDCTHPFEHIHLGKEIKSEKSQIRFVMFQIKFCFLPNNSIGNQKKARQPNLYTKYEFY